MLNGNTVMLQKFKSEIRNKKRIKSAKFKPFKQNLTSTYATDKNVINVKITFRKFADIFSPILLIKILKTQIG